MNVVRIHGEERRANLPRIEPRLSPKISGDDKDHARQHHQCTRE